ncbi:MAG: hypothetical protein R3F43_27405 [bacterium]
MDQYCGLWNDSSGEYRGFNRAHIPSYLAYVEGIRALGAEVVSDFPFRVLGDEQLESCWRVAAEVVGLAGSPADVTRLLAWAKQVRLGGRRYATYGQAGKAVYGLGFAFQGLGLAVAHLGEAAPVSDEIVEFLTGCLEFDYWRSGVRLPQVEASWDMEISQEEAESDLAYAAVMTTFGSLEVTGASEAIAALVAYQNRIASLPEWDGRLRGGRLPSLQKGIEAAIERRRMGLEAYIRRKGGAF